MFYFYPLNKVGYQCTWKLGLVNFMLGQSIIKLNYLFSSKNISKTKLLNRYLEKCEWKEKNADKGNILNDNM